MPGNIVVTSKLSVARHPVLHVIDIIDAAEIGEAGIEIYARAAGALDHINVSVA